MEDRPEHHTSLVSMEELTHAKALSLQQPNQVDLMITSHFTDGETWTQRHLVTCPGHTMKQQSQDLRPDHLAQTGAPSPAPLGKRGLQPPRNEQVSWA